MYAKLNISDKSGIFMKKKQSKKGKKVELKGNEREKVKNRTLWPRSMYFMATSSLVSLFLKSLATPKFPEPKSLTTSYLSIIKSSTETRTVTVNGYGWKKRLKKVKPKMGMQVAVESRHYSALWSKGYCKRGIFHWKIGSFFLHIYIYK